MIKNYVDQFGAKNIYIAWDKRLVYSDTQPILNFRKKLLGEYKGNRPKGDTANEVHKQEDTFRAVLSTLGIKHLHPRILEADDVIAWLSKKIEGRIVIISNDADLLQLINERVVVFNPIKKITVDHLNFEKMIGVSINDYISYRAVQGDSSDNIKGIKGFGPKKAQKFISNKIEGIKNLTQEQVDIYNRNLKLMDLSKGIMTQVDEEPAYQEQFDKVQDTKPDMQRFYKYCQDLEFKSILNSFNTYLVAFGK